MKNNSIEADHSVTNIICPSCTERNAEEVHFCKKCNAPISSYASTAPFERIFSEGAVYRSAFQKPDRPVILVGVWLLFLPMFLAGLFMVLALTVGMFDSSRFGPESAYTSIVGVASLFLSTYILYITTKNFIRNRKVAN